jgi:5-methylcytosine-specific restriction endonuclease McrA
MRNGTSPSVLAIKERIRARDGYRCAECGMTQADHVERYRHVLDIHRNEPGSVYSLAPGACVTLCRPCHGPKAKREPGSFRRKYRYVALRWPHWRILEQLAKENDRTPSEELSHILKESLREKGYWPPAKAAS